ncbi:MAG TPA: AAA family ATPase [Candidatus Nanoarchaeia archaeon]|nr:AAA family ATPase [Candidatus Nanoarchaeia archaeon]
MIIKKVKLENIRSYKSQEVDFENGSTLLSGDIGSGKSTILLAVEFALFGLLKGELSGDGLLRKGENKGSVELHFKIDDKDIVVKRNLKKSSTGIAQDTGSIIVNNNKKELGAVELKQHVLDLLNYPKELLTKSKSLIYRYTVYTPQEDMKAILTTEAEYRVDTLRKVFGIDKYKRIKDNANIVVSKIKEKRKEFLGKIYDLDSKKIEKESKIKEIKLVNDKLNLLKPKLSLLKEKLTEKKKEISIFEDKMKKFSKISEELRTSESLLNLRSERLNVILNEENTLSKNIIELKKEFNNNLKDFDENKFKTKKIDIEKIELKIKEIIRKTEELKHKINSANEIKNDISKLDVCPLCKQNVSNDHILNISKNENDKISKFELELKKIQGEERENEKILENAKKELEELRTIESNLKLTKVKAENLREREVNLLRINKEIKVLTSEKDKLTRNISILSKDFNENKNLEENYGKARKEFDSLLNEERSLDIERAEFEVKIKDLENFSAEIEKEIESKLKIKKNLDNLIGLQDFIENTLTNLVETMEKKVMMKIHYDFDHLVQKWFFMLVDAESISLKLSDDFSPVIIQNEHEIDYGYLSGGEKTAVALAYRLGLNQVVNSIMNTIKTRDLIILDEPTDGFSSEQLDRLKNVFDELDINQIILVSHESKVESFVENIIKVKKENHISEAA